MQKKDFLFELLTEELPPKNLKRLSRSLLTSVENGLQKSELQFDTIRVFATPRRLAIFISQLSSEQPQQVIERRGPALEVAFDAKGKPTPACLGFAKSCGVSIAQLETLETSKGSWVYFKTQKEGRKATDLMPKIIDLALSKLPVGKMMRWADFEVEFVRPVHNVVMLYGNRIIEATFFNCKATDKTKGHRFLSPDYFKIIKPLDYETLLQKHFVIADFEKRRNMIRDQIEAIATKHKAKAIVNNDLLDEVTALVEWPVALLAKFSSSFLDLPKEVIIASVQKHQKSFLLENKKGELLAFFITISNIKAFDSSQIIQGNERVMAARLSDAQFFYVSDLKESLEGKALLLETILFQKQLGNLLEKTQRIAELSQMIAKLVGANTQQAERAAFLSKADLNSEMVSEFPELQGIMGYYYAKHHGETGNIPEAIREHYMPTHANAALPKTLEGSAVALADRIDTLIGIFGVNKKPTGDKDPFGLRRAALGIIRIIIEGNLSIHLLSLLEFSESSYQGRLVNKEVVQEVFEFILDRLKYWSIEQHQFSANLFQSVRVVSDDDLLDFLSRMEVVREFEQLAGSVNLIAAHKRVNNLLSKETVVQKNIREDLLTEKDEKRLVKAIMQQQKNTQKLVEKKCYLDILKTLSTIRHDVDQFFDHVMVMVEDGAVRQNRLAILFNLRALFLQVADIGLL